jgi:hypothetical protein
MQAMVSDIDRKVMGAHYYKLMEGCRLHSRISVEKFVAVGSCDLSSSKASKILADSSEDGWIVLNKTSHPYAYEYASALATESEPSMICSHLKCLRFY